MKNIKKWDFFKKNVYENLDNDDVQNDVQNVQEDEEMEIKTNKEIKSEEDLKDFFNID